MRRCGSMDCRVKPGNDESKPLAPYSFNFRRRCASVRNRSALSRIKPSASR
jgi:hypothetical protein